MPLIQEIIHKFEEGKWAKVINLFALFLLFVALAMLFDFRCYRSFASEEPMDLAQLARNISQKKGYTTDYVRPFSAYLLKTKRDDHDPMLKGDHPDIANAPVYPTMLAGLMSIKAIPFKFMSPTFTRGIYQPELIIAIFNQLLFFLCILIVFWIGQRFFGLGVAWLSATLFALTELFWRFSVSGLPTMLMILLFLLLAWNLLALIEPVINDVAPGKRSFFLAVSCGVLIGLGCLTRYSFGWMIFPVLGFLCIFMGEHRLKTVSLALLAFILVVSPWLVRNYKVSGTLFGTASYAIYQQTPSFFENWLERSMDPSAKLRKTGVADFARKFVVNARSMIVNEIPHLGGNWVTAFFLAGLLLPFSNPMLSRFRIFLLLSFFTLFFVQALGKTSLAPLKNPEMCSENLLVLLAPLLFLYGVASFFVLLDQLSLPMPQLRPLITGLLTTIFSLPLFFSLLPPTTFPMVYPPYYPPNIQEVCGWMRPRELMMSDIPWAIAWYGDQQCSHLTLDYGGGDFYKLNDDIKPVLALYLSPDTIDGHLQTQLAKDRNGWGGLILQILFRGEVPTNFPLKKAPIGFVPNQIFLTDWERWKLHPGSTPR